jgi:hypothetical protein
MQNKIETTHVLRHIRSSEQRQTAEFGLALEAYPSPKAVQLTRRYQGQSQRHPDGWNPNNKPRYPGQ